MHRLIGAFLFLLAFAMAGPASAEQRIALVVGNSAYRNAPALTNPAGDASAVTQALQRLGFETELASDLTRQGMDDAFRGFARRARTADVALFYYAGHAMQYEGRNYLMPVDAKLADEIDLRYEMTSVDDVFAAMKPVRGVRIVILDSCRDNPLADALLKSLDKSRSAFVPRGLARIEQQAGTIIAYATQAGTIADDGAAGHSPFARAFLANVETPGLEIGQMFRRVAKAVNDATGGVQTPELSVSLLNEFYMKPQVAVAQQAAVAAPNTLIVEIDGERLKAQTVDAMTGRVFETLDQGKIAVTVLEPAPEALNLVLAKAASATKASQALDAAFGPVGTGNCRPSIAAKASSLRIGFDQACLGTASAELVSDLAVALTRRLTQFKLDGLGVRILDGGRIEISYAGPGRDPAQVAELLKSGSLSLRLVDSDDKGGTALPPGEILLPGDSGDDKTYRVNRQAILTGAHVLDAQAAVSDWGQPTITLKLDTAGADAFAKATTANVGRAIAIVFDDKVLSAPVIREPITGGLLQISGDMSLEKTQMIAGILRAGQLPAPVRLIEQH